ncbi:hypothetical protein [Rhizobium sp. RCAM05973]|uniref:DUF7666 domain-containing protein n=1 Tax=Rhizobium sp. RCAM05973 TaxID=2994066 RepID=UPI0022EC0765|nr:hypothetical protein [Rhizobium sp. RCAM05973]
MARRAANTDANAAATSVGAIVAYKGYNKDLICNPAGDPFQYKIGETYENGGKSVRRCGGGAFHSCEMPQDTFNYYGPATSRYTVVEPSGEIAREENSDTKIASAKITIGVELHLGELARRAVAWVAEMAKKQGNGQFASGNYGHASAAGDGGHASAAGYRGHASASGNYGHASAAGDGGHASAAGYRGHASAAGNYGHASAAGYRGHASAAGNYGHASAAGNYGHASAAGDGGHASASGNYGHASAAGDGGHASAAGYRGHASASGNYGHASAAGDGGHASAAGDGGHAEVKGTCAVAHAPGVCGTAIAVEGSAISLAYYDESVYPPKLVAVRSSMVGENGIEAGKKYRLTKSSEFEVVD